MRSFYVPLVVFTTQKVSKYGGFYGLYFPVFGLNTEIDSVFSLNTRKYGPGKNSIFGYFLRSVLLKSPTADKGLEAHQTSGTKYSKIKQVKFVEDSL